MSAASICRLRPGRDGRGGQGALAAGAAASLLLAAWMGWSIPARGAGRGPSTASGGLGDASAWSARASLAAETAAAANAGDSGPRELSARSRELLRYGCGNSLGRREVTLFANGTIRLREGPLGKEEMGLAELGPDELDLALRQLAEEDLGGVERPVRGLDGEWIEQCELAVQLPAKRLQLFHFGRYDTLPLALSRVVRVADQLAGRVKDLKRDEELPERYEPAAGDLLKRKDGVIFRVLRFTSDDKAVELEGVDQPFEIYVPRDQMRKVFVALVARRR